MPKCVHAANCKGCHSGLHASHHITQRGNNRQDVFFVDDDRLAYLSFLKEHSERYGLTVEAYCLMTNHVHIIAVPQGPDSLAKAIGRTHLQYTQYINRMHGRSGHLWQNRYFSCTLGEEHFWTALCYVERNPVRVGLVRKAWRYRWSSAAAHCGQGDESGLLKLQEWERTSAAVEWEQSLSQPQDTQLVRLLRSSTDRGRPLGSDSFVSKLEQAMG